MDVWYLNFREVLLEKQLTGHRVDRAICDWFWDQILTQGDSLKVTRLQFWMDVNFIFGSLCCLVGFYFNIEPFSFPCDVTARACDCFSHPLPISSCSWGDHLLGVHPSWDAAFDGNWGGCPESWFFYSVVVVSFGTLNGMVDSKTHLPKHELALSMSIPWSIDEWLTSRFLATVWNR